MLRSPTLFQPPEEPYPGRNSSELGRPLLVNDSLSNWGKLSEALIRCDKKIEKICAEMSAAKIALINAETARSVAWMNYEDFKTVAAFFLYKTRVKEHMEACEEYDNLDYLLSITRGQRISIQSQLNKLELENHDNNDDEPEAEQCDESSAEDEASDDEEDIQTNITANGYSRL